MATRAAPGDHRRGLSPCSSRGRRFDAVFIATIAILQHLGIRGRADRDLETNDELRGGRDAERGLGALGGVPAYHALSLTALADRMKVDARAVG